MAKTYTWNETYGRIDVSGGTALDLVTFDDIVDYFEENPLSLNYDLPRYLANNELCENNSANWFGANGMGTPSDDAVDYNLGSYSIKSTVSSVPTGVAITRVRSDVSYVYVYMTDTSSFSVGDECVIVGTTNFDGYMARVQSISTNTYVRFYYSNAKVPVIDETGISGATLLKQLQLAWNTDFAVKPNVSPYFNIAMCDKLKISAKSDGAGSPKIVGLAVRTTGSPSAPTTANSYYGANINVDWDLTSDWQDFELDIRDMYNYLSLANRSGARGYWEQVVNVYVFFEGVSATESVWIDGLRFTNSDRNPQRIASGNYVFTTGLGIEDWFKDYGFNVRFDVLESYIQGTSYPLFNFSADNLGEIQFGDYDGEKKNGGTFFFNVFCDEDVGDVDIYKIQFQNIKFSAPKTVYGGFNFGNGCLNNQYRNCTWENMLNFLGSETNTKFKDCVFSGGRYLMAFPADNITIDGITCYGVSSKPFFTKTQTYTSTFTGVKIIDERTTNRDFVYGYSYGTAVGTRDALRLINLDLADSGTGLRSNISNNSSHTLPQSPKHYIASTFDLRVVDEDGNAIEGAEVTMLDKDSNELFSLTTNSNGEIDQQIIDIMHHQHDTIPPSGSSTDNAYFDTPETAWSLHYPFSLTITKDGYSEYSEQVLKDGYSRTSNICKSGYNGRIALQDKSGGGGIINASFIKGV